MYFLYKKFDVFSIFEKFKTMVETQGGCKIENLRSDGGKEYTFVEFEHFCEDERVQHQLTVAYTPEQNGFCERKNRTIMEMA